MVRLPKNVFAGLGILLLAILACQPAPPPTRLSSNVSIEDALTIVVQTLTAQIPAPTLPGLPSNTATVTPSFTLGPANTSKILPTLTIMPSPTTPLVSVSRPTNCRTGPSASFDRVVVVDLGVTYQVIGKYTPDNYWIVIIPGIGQCWLWGQYASVSGNVESLPEMVPPPTLTSTSTPTSTPANGAVSGIITAGYLGNLPEVLVTAQLSKITTTTNSDGIYYIGDLPPGPEFITVEYSSLKPKFQSVNINAGTTVTANFELQGNVFDKFIGTAKGLVLINSEPAAGVKVWIWAVNASGVTNSDGRYQIDFEYNYDGRDPNGSILLILAELGNLRGGIEWDISQPGGIPDIILLPR